MVDKKPQQAVITITGRREPDPIIRQGFLRAWAVTIDDRQVLVSAPFLMVSRG